MRAYAARPGAGGKDVAQAARELSAPLLRYLERYVGNRELAEDLAQETLVRVARGLPGFAERASLKTWAFTIATRVAAEHFRRRCNRVRIVDIGESAEAPDNSVPIEQGLVADEMSACVREVIDSLPPDYRAALVLHDMEGMSGPETAEICGCSLAAAKIRIHRARARLAAALRGGCSFYRDRDNVLRCDRKK